MFIFFIFGTVSIRLSILLMFIFFKYGTRCNSFINIVIVHFFQNCYKMQFVYRCCYCLYILRQFVRQYVTSGTIELTLSPRQMFMRHNETCNIWTHLVGLAIFIAITISMAYDWGRYRLPRLPDTWTFGECILILLVWAIVLTPGFFLTQKGMNLSTPLRRLSTATSGTSPPPRRTPGGGYVSPRRTSGLRSEPRCCRRAIKSGTPSML